MDYQKKVEAQLIRMRMGKRGQDGKFMSDMVAVQVETKIRDDETTFEVLKVYPKPVHASDVRRIYNNLVLLFSGDRLVNVPAPDYERLERTGSAAVAPARERNGPRARKFVAGDAA